MSRIWRVSRHRPEGTSHERNGARRAGVVAGGPPRPLAGLRVPLARPPGPAGSVTRCRSRRGRCPARRGSCRGRRLTRARAGCRGCRGQQRRRGQGSHPGRRWGEGSRRAPRGARTAGASPNPDHQGRRRGERPPGMPSVSWAWHRGRAWRRARETQAGSASGSVQESARASALGRGSAWGSEPGSASESAAGSAWESGSTQESAPAWEVGWAQEWASARESGSGAGVGFGCGVGCGFSVGVKTGGGAFGAGFSDAAGATGAVGTALGRRDRHGDEQQPCERGRQEDRQGTSRVCAGLQEAATSSERAERTYARATAGASRPREATSMVRASPRAMTCGAPAPSRDAHLVTPGTAR